MFGDHFYHETIKRAVSVFGTLFNNISIKRANGTFIVVPSGLLILILLNNVPKTDTARLIVS